MALLEPIEIANGEPHAAAGELVFPCTSAQEWAWFMDQVNPEAAVLNVSLRWDLRGAIDEDHVERAFAAVIERHEVLRSRFFDRDGEPMMQVLDAAAFHLVRHDLRPLPADQQGQRVDALGQEDAEARFDLAEAPLIRVLLLRLTDERVILLITVHHLCFDGWSIRLLGREFGELVQSMAERRPPNLPALPLQYGDFALWQREFMASEAFGAEIDYWKRQLAGAPYFEIAPDRPRPSRPQHRSAMLSHDLSLAEGEQMQEAAKTRGVSLFTFGAAIIGAVLARLSGESDVLIGTQVAGRDDVDLETLIGMFINNIVLRFDAADDPTFETFLGRVGTIVKGALTHQRVPFQRLVRELNPHRDASRNPLVSVNFIMQKAFLENARYGAMELRGAPSQSAGSMYDLNFFVVGRPGGWRMTVEYNSELFDASTGHILLDLWRRAIELFVAGPTAPLSRLAVPARQRALAANQNVPARFADIERALATHPRIAAACVRDLGGQMPHAYVVPKSGTRELLDEWPASLEAYLSQMLPVERRPAGISVVMDLPRRDGGVDLAALPLPRRGSSPATVAVPAGFDATEARLAAIWREVLDVAAVDPDASFFDLGGHSLIVVRMLARVKKEFSADKINLATLFEAPTLRQFARLLHKQPEPAGEAENAISWRLIRIKDGTSPHSLIAFNHSVLYHRLARYLADDRPVYDLQIVDPGPVEDLPEQPFEDIVAHCVRQIRAAQPHGPYTLFGLCVNGAVAVEAARQLRRAGETVSLVAICDTWAPGHASKLSRGHRFLRRWHFRAHKFAWNFGRMRRGELSWSGFLGTYGAFNRFASRLGLSAGYVETPEDIRNRRVADYLMRAAKRHHPEPYDGRVVIFRSNEAPSGRLFDEKFGWGDILTGELEVRRVPGWHESMFYEGGAQVIARHTRQLLETIEHAPAAGE